MMLALVPLDQRVNEYMLLEPIEDDDVFDEDQEEDEETEDDDED